jgi:hypothetical protein
MQGCRILASIRTGLGVLACVRILPREGVSITGLTYLVCCVTQRNGGISKIEPIVKDNNNNRAPYTPSIL